MQLSAAGRARHAAVTCRSGTPASRGPQRSTWGEVGWEELSDGVIVAGQPSGAPSWFPCNDRPDNKATYRLTVTAESSYVVIANGLLVDRHTGASRTTWVYEQEQPMATYLATVQIGRYDVHELAATPVPQHLIVPQRVRRDAVARLRATAGRCSLSSTSSSGPTRSTSYTVVVTDDDLEIPLEAQGVSIFGAQPHGRARAAWNAWWRTSWPTSGSATA